jgi:hypothetical protein
MACNNGTVSGNPSRTGTGIEIVTPDLVTRSDGNLYFRVERDAHRDRSASCSAALPTGPCTATPETPALFAQKVMLEPACVQVAIPEQDP